MENIKEMRNKHSDEIAKFIEECYHTDVRVEDTPHGYSGKSITIFCNRCGLNLLGYIVDGRVSYLAYIRDCVKEYQTGRY